MPRPKYSTFQTEIKKLYDSMFDPRTGSDPLKGVKPKKYGEGVSEDDPFRQIYLTRETIRTSLLTLMDPGKTADEQNSAWVRLNETLKGLEDDYERRKNTPNSAERLKDDATRQTWLLYRGGCAMLDSLRMMEQKEALRTDTMNSIKEELNKAARMRLVFNEMVKKQSTGAFLNPNHTTYAQMQKAKAEYEQQAAGLEQEAVRLMSDEHQAEFAAYEKDNKSKRASYRTAASDAGTQVETLTGQSKAVEAEIRQLTWQLTGLDRQREEVRTHETEYKAEMADREAEMKQMRLTRNAHLNRRDHYTILSNQSNRVIAQADEYFTGLERDIANKPGSALTAAFRSKEELNCLSNKERLYNLIKKEDGLTALQRDMVGFFSEYANDGFDPDSAQTIEEAGRILDSGDEDVLQDEAIKRKLDYAKGYHEMFDRFVEVFGLGAEDEKAARARYTSPSGLLHLINKGLISAKTRKEEVLGELIGQEKNEDYRQQYEELIRNADTRRTERENLAAQEKGYQDEVEVIAGMQAAYDEKVTKYNELKATVEGTRFEEERRLLEQKISERRAALDDLNVRAQKCRSVYAENMAKANRLEEELEKRRSAEKDVISRYKFASGRADTLDTQIKSVETINRDIVGPAQLQYSTVAGKFYTGGNSPSIGREQFIVPFVEQVRAGLKRFLETEGVVNNEDENSTAYKNMISSLKAVAAPEAGQPDPLAGATTQQLSESLERVRTAAQDYLDAKHRQLFHWVPSAKRKVRLNFAENLVHFTESANGQIPGLDAQLDDMQAFYTKYVHGPAAFMDSIKDKDTLITQHMIPAARAAMNGEIQEKREDPAVKYHELSV